MKPPIEFSFRENNKEAFLPRRFCKDAAVGSFLGRGRVPAADDMETKMQKDKYIKSKQMNFIKVSIL